MVRKTADTISNVAHDIAEPADKKKLREAREELASRNGRLYRYDFVGSDEYLASLFEVDERFKEALATLGLSVVEWKKISWKIFYIVTIKQLSRDVMDYSKKNTRYMRERIINEWSKKPNLARRTKFLLQGLDFFHIKQDDWIEYGEAVIEMYNLYDSEDLKEFGVICAIYPTANNKHLL